NLLKVNWPLAGAVLGQAALLRVAPRFIVSNTLLDPWLLIPSAALWVIAAVWADKNHAEFNRRAIGAFRTVKDLRSMIRHYKRLSKRVERFATGDVQRLWAGLDEIEQIARDIPSLNDAIRTM